MTRETAKLKGDARSWVVLVFAIAALVVNTVLAVRSRAEDDVVWLPEFRVEDSLVPPPIQKCVGFRCRGFVIISELPFDQTRHIATNLIVFQEILRSAYPSAAFHPQHDVQIFIARAESKKKNGHISKNYAPPLLAPTAITVLAKDRLQDTESFLRQRCVQYALRLAGVPLWYEEGLSILLSSAEFDGEALRIGRPPFARTGSPFLISTNPGMFKFHDIFDATRSGSLYIDEASRFKLKLQSAAFLHYCLFHRRTDFRPNLSRFLCGPSSGNVDSDFMAAFGFPIDKLVIMIRSNYSGTGLTYKVEVRHRNPELPTIEPFQPRQLDLLLLEANLLLGEGHPDVAFLNLKSSYDAIRIDGGVPPRGLLATLAACKSTAQDWQQALRYLADCLRVPNQHSPCVDYYVIAYVLAHVTPGLTGSISQEEAKTLRGMLRSVGQPESEAPPEFYAALALLALHAEGPLSPDELNAINVGARTYPNRLDVIEPVALALDRYGQTSRAVEICQTGATWAPEESSRTRLRLILSRLSRKR